MRLTENQIQVIQHIAHELIDEHFSIYLFGSRLNDLIQGGDVDLLFEFEHSVANPALIAAQLSARISRTMAGRKVDVLIAAPNLKRLPIHDTALREGLLLGFPF